MNRLLLLAWEMKGYHIECYRKLVVKEVLN